jgi:predicted nucleotidyltransferase
LDREKLAARREAHVAQLYAEAERLADAAADLGAQKVVLFGSVARDAPGLTSDLDLLIVLETELPFVERVVAVYRALQPRCPVDLLVYTPEEMMRMVDRPFIRHALEDGKVLYEA